jgi:non-ribosomal peptide synthetase component F
MQPPRYQYIDYSVHERTLLMTETQNYWREVLQDYGWSRQLELGARQMRSPSARRTDRGSSLSITIPSEIVHSMIVCAHELNVTLFQLGLSCFYLFLTQLSSHNRDACVGVIHLNRYRPELASMIGMFINVLPCRISIDSLHTLSFIELVHKVQQIFLASVQHAHLPYYQMIDLHREPNPHLQLPFLQTVFRVDTLAIDYNNMNILTLGDSCHLSNYAPYNLSNQHGGNKFDLEVSLIYDKVAEKIECGWCYMLDVFERDIINMHANRFIHLLTQLFGSISAEQIQLPLGKTITIDEEDKDKAKEEGIDYQVSKQTYI